MLSLSQTETTQVLWIYWRGIDTEFRAVNVPWFKIVILLCHSSPNLFQNNMNNKKKAFCVPRKAVDSSDVVEGSDNNPKPPPVKVIRRSSANPTPTRPTATLKTPLILDAPIRIPKPKLPQQTPSLSAEPTLLLAIPKPKLSKHTNASTQPLNVVQTEFDGSPLDPVVEAKPHSSPGPLSKQTPVETPIALLDTQTRARTPKHQLSKQPKQSDKFSYEHKSDQNPPQKGKIELKPPMKPSSPFSVFLIKNRDEFIKSGLSSGEATNKAVKMWQVKSQAVKNKFNIRYQKQKAKYDADVIKYNDKVKKKKEREEKKKGLFFF